MIASRRRGSPAAHCRVRRHRRHRARRAGRRRALAAASRHGALGRGAHRGESHRARPHRLGGVRRHRARAHGLRHRSGPLVLPHARRGDRSRVVLRGHARRQRRPPARRAHDALYAADPGRALSARISGVRARGPEPRTGQRHRARRDAGAHAAPLGVLLAAVLLLVAAEVGGASMGRYKVELARWARTAMLAHPAVHGRVGVRDVDERVLDEALFRFDAGLRLFHMHAEGMALVVIVTTTVATTLARSPVARRALILLLTIGGVGYPLGYLVWSALIPAYGVERSKAIAEYLLWIPLGGATIVALLWLAVLTAARVVRR